MQRTQEIKEEKNAFLINTHLVPSIVCSLLFGHPPLNMTYTSKVISSTGSGSGSPPITGQPLLCTYLPNPVHVIKDTTTNDLIISGYYISASFRSDYLVRVRSNDSVVELVVDGFSYVNSLVEDSGEFYAATSYGVKKILQNGTVLTVTSVEFKAMQFYGGELYVLEGYPNGRVSILNVETGQTTNIITSGLNFPSNMAIFNDKIYKYCRYIS